MGGWLLATTSRPPDGGNLQFVEERARVVRRICAAHTVDVSTIVVAPHGYQFAVTALCHVRATTVFPRDPGGRNVVWMINSRGYIGPIPKGIAIDSFVELVDDSDLRRFVREVPPLLVAKLQDTSMVPFPH